MYNIAELIDLASQDVKIKNKKALCPFHRENTPSLTFFAGKDGRGRWKCHGCGKDGDAIDWLVEVRNMSKAEAIKLVAPELAKTAGSPATPPSAAREPLQPWEDLPTSAPKKLGSPHPSRKALDEHGRPPDSIYQFFGPDYQDGQLPVNQFRWNARDDKPKDLRWQFGAHGRRLVYLGRVQGVPRDPDALVFCEGAKDAKHVTEAGYHSVGIASSAHPYMNVIQWIHANAKARTWILWPDADNPGIKAMENLARQAFKAGVKEVRWIDSDLESAAKGSGAADVHVDLVPDRILRSRPIDPEGLENLAKRKEHPVPGSDSHIAGLFVEAAGDRLLFDVRSEQWQKFSPHAGFESLHPAAIWTDVQRFCVANAHLVEHGSGPFKRLHQAAGANGVYQCVNRALHVDGLDSFDSNPDLIGLPGGLLYDSSTGRQRPQTPADRLRTTLAVTPKDGPTSLFSRYLKDTFGPDKELVRYICRSLGYMLTGHTKEAKAWYWHGPKGTGKSTLVRIMKHISGGYGTLLPEDAVLVNRFDPHPEIFTDLIGARYACLDEVPPGRKINDAQFNRLIDGGQIRMRFMRQGGFQQDIKAKYVIASNYLPETPAITSGLRRRLVIVPFVRPVETMDMGFTERLVRNESNAIAALLLREAAQWRADSLESAASSGLLDAPQAVTRATDKWKGITDDFSDFQHDCLSVGNAKAGTSSKHLHEAYMKWARQQNIDRTWSQRKLSDVILERINSPALRYSKKVPESPGSMRRTRGFFGIEVRPESLWGTAPGTEDETPF